MELREIIIFIVACIVAYFLGGVSIARLMTKKENKGGIKSQGSGNPGTMNMLRTHGIGLGLFTLLCDAIKGVIPTLFGLLYFSHFAGQSMGYIAGFTFGLSAVIGHIFPIYYKFKGGKGIATTFGVFMVIDPLSTVILFGILFVTLYFIKIGSIVSLLFIIIDGVVQLYRNYLTGNWIAKIIMWVMITIDIIAHKDNILRLIDNKENPADLQEGLQKDIEKIKQKKQRKINKQIEKQERVEKKYDDRIKKKSDRVKKKIDKIGTNS